MRTCIINGDVVTPGAILKNTAVLIGDGKIVSVGGGVKRQKDTAVIDAKGLFVSPGFIDTHIHGSPDEIFKNEIRSGTTAVVIAESCASQGEISRNIRAIEEFVIKSPFGRNVLGVRLEGPYISKAKAGAQDRRHIHNPDEKGAGAFIKECGPLLKIMTVAPEIKGAIPLIKLLRRKGIIASAGHTNARYSEAVRGIDAGLGHATHTFNAMRGPDGRDPGASTAIMLSDKIKAEVIPDLVHVPKGLLGVLLRIKGINKTILVTDSVRAEKRGKLSGGVYRLNDGTVAGSGLTMMGALKNCVKRCGVPLRDAVKMATVNPAGLLGLGRRKGRIAPGMDADIVLFDRRFVLQMTIMNGEIVYRKKALCAA